MYSFIVAMNLTVLYPIVYFLVMSDYYCTS